MKTLNKTSLVPALVCALLLAGSASAFALHAIEALAWHPPQGATLRRELVTKQFLVTESMTFRQGEQTTVSQRVFDLQSVTTLRTSDRLLEVGEGRPLRLRRFYDEARVEVKSEVSGGRQQSRGLELNGSSAFQGKSVMFTWVPEDQEYGRYYDSLEGREEDLVGLDEDLGLRSLMPAEAVAEGDQWQPPISFLRDLFAPGGDLGYDFSGSKDPLVARSLSEGVGANLFRAFGGEQSGEVKARWLRTEDADGRRLAVIALEFDVELSNDLAELANSLRAVNEIAAGQVTAQALMTLELEGGGELRWDLDAGCLFDTDGLRADERLTFTKAVESEREGELVRSEQTLVMTGTLLQESRVTLE